MKGLSLTQPWATLVAIGAKRIETRSWSTSYRGELAIHAAKTFPSDCQALCWKDPFASTLIAAGIDRPEQLPTGVILAIARLDGCWRTDGMQIVHEMRGHFDDLLTDQERAFGDFSPGRFGWVLRDVRRLETPIQAAHLTRDGHTRPGGALGLWGVPDTLHALMLQQLRRTA